MCIPSIFFWEIPVDPGGIKVPKMAKNCTFWHIAIGKKVEPKSCKIVKIDFKQRHLNQCFKGPVDYQCSEIT